MYQFIETICYREGCFQRIELHNERCNLTRNHFFGIQHPLRLESILKIPNDLTGEIVKCTVTYGIDIEHVEYLKYQMRLVKSLQMVYDDSIEYAYKFADRSKLVDLHQFRGQCDDILIIKNGLITDTSYANAIFKRNNIWYSQQRPLLFGTRLQSYIKEGRVTPALLRPKNLPLFTEVRIINAMISIEDSPVIQICNIKV